MTAWFQLMRTSPVLARVVPFAVFVGLTMLQGRFGEGSRYWFYLAKTVLGAGLLWVVWPAVAELRWRVSWEAVGVGIAVFVVWVGLDPWYPKLGKAAPAWNPFAAFGDASGLGWLFILARLVGVVLVVPPLEEVFYRSFLYRYLRKADFGSLSLAAFHGPAFVATSVVFGLTHREWLAGILCGLAYQGLVCAKGRLGDAMVAHAITNLLLGLWVVVRGAWQFW